MAYNSVTDNTVRLAVIASETREMSQNSKVIDLGVMESPYVTPCSSLIVTLAVSATVFEIFRLKDSKSADFTHPSLV